MTKNHHRWPLFSLISLTILAASLSGCVSVNLGPKKPGRAENIRYLDPAAPFDELKNPIGDRGWQSSETGSTISYFSECPQAPSTLEALTTEFLAVLKKNEILSQETKFYNAREALDTVAEGSLDGIAMKVASTVFKRNGCSYTITFVARKDQFAKEEKTFQGFLQSFEAP